MASSSTLLTSSSPLLQTLSSFPNNKPTTQIHFQQIQITKQQKKIIKAQTLDFSGTFFEGGLGDDISRNSSGSSVATAIEEKEEPQCPPGLRQYETMAVLRPDMSEDERLSLTHKYEEVILFFITTFFHYC